MDIKKYTHKIKVFRDRWLRDPRVVDISLPYVPQEFTRPDEVVETFHIDWEEQRLVQKKHLIQGDEERKKALEINWDMEERKKKGNKKLP